LEYSSTTLDEAYLFDITLGVPNNHLICWYGQNILNVKMPKKICAISKRSSIKNYQINWNYSHIFIVIIIRVGNIMNGGTIYYLWNRFLLSIYFYFCNIGSVKQQIDRIPRIARFYHFSLFLFYYSRKFWQFQWKKSK